MRIITRCVLVSCAVNIVEGKYPFSHHWNASGKFESIEKALGPHLPALKLVHVVNTTTTNTTTTRTAATIRDVFIVCWVNTYDKNHATRVEAVKHTWGRKCDRLHFFSNRDDPSIPTIQVVAPSTHESLWAKHRGVLKILAREYAGTQQADPWFFKCDDDTFVLMENLRSFLNRRTEDPASPVLLGHRMTLPWWELRRPFAHREEHYSEHLKAFHAVNTRFPQGLHYTPGGGGYAMNLAYLLTVTAALETPYCLEGVANVPDDWALSFCMSQFNITPSDTRDRHARERFHQYPPSHVYYHSHETSVLEASPGGLNNTPSWFTDHRGIGWQNGSNCCAADSIAFHYIQNNDMYLFYDYFYPLSPNVSSLPTTSLPNVSSSTSKVSSVSRLQHLRQDGFLTS